MKVLVISAHPDDETLGCGGALLKHEAAGDSLFWLIATQAHQPKWSAETISCKAKEVDAVAEAYPIEKYFKLGFPAGRLDTIPIADLMDSIFEVIKATSPEIIYLVNGGDIHTDHRVIFTAVMSVLKPFNSGALGVRKVLCYETLSSTEAAPPQPDRAFLPNVFIDVTPYIDRKIEILQMYQTETQAELLPRNASTLRAQARLRGATIGADFAEAFVLIRELA